MRLLVAVAILFSSLPIVTATPPNAAAVRRARTTNTNLSRLALPTPDETPTPSPTPTPDRVLEQAERDAKLAEELKKKAVSDKERVAAENDKLKAQVQPLGAPNNITIPTGSVSTDSAGWVESQMLAQEAARQIAQDLSDRLCGLATPVIASTDRSSLPAMGGLRTLVVYNQPDLTAVELYVAVMGQLELLQEELDTMNALAVQARTGTDPKTGNGQFMPSNANARMHSLTALPAVLAAPGVATGIIKSIAELVNLFRTDTTFANQQVTISVDQVVSYVVNDLSTSDQCRSVRTYYPAVYPPNVLASATRSALINLIRDVDRSNTTAGIHIEAIEARIKELTKFIGLFGDRKNKTKARDEKQAAYDKDCKNKNTAACKKLKKEIEDLNKAIKEVNDALVAGVGNNPEDRVPKFKGWNEKLGELKTKMQALVTATGLILTKLNTPDEGSKLTALAQLLRAERLHAIMDDDNAYTLRVDAKANGTTKIKKNLFVDAKVRHSAGADLVYQLFDRSGFIKQAGVMQCYIEYQSSNDVHDIVSGIRGVECRSQMNNGAAGQAKNSKNGSTQARR